MASKARLKYNGEEIYPITSLDCLVDAVGSTASVLDSDGKIKKTYIPDDIVTVGAGLQLDGSTVSVKLKSDSCLVADDDGLGVDVWTPIIDKGSSASVTIESNHSYKLLATGTHQLSVGTCPSGYTGQDALITIIVGVAGTVQTVAPLKTSATFTSASINDCVVKFRDGKAFLLVENTEEAYVVSVTSGTEEGSLPYGLANNASVIMFAPATSGQSIALSGVTAAISDGVSLFGNGTASTLLGGGELTCSGELRASDLTFNAGAVIKGGVLTCTNVLLSQEVRFSSCVINNASVSNGMVALNDGSVANNCTLGKGELDVSSGCVANNTIHTSGALVLFEGGKVTNTVNHDGSVVIQGGVVTKTSLYGGSLQVYGGTVSDTFANWNGSTTFGVQIYGAGPCAILNTEMHSSGGLYVQHSACVANNVTAYDCSVNIASGGTATDIVVYGGSGRLEVSSRGTVNRATVTNGRAYLYGGCVATDFLLTSGRTEIHDANTTVSGVTVNTGSAVIYSSATVTDFSMSGDVYIDVSTKGVLQGGITVEPGQRVTVGSGASVYDITENGGFVDNYSGALVTFVPHIISGGTYSAMMSLHSGTIAEDITVMDHTLLVYESGIADNVTITPAGSMVVFSGGTASIPFNPWQGNIISSAGAVISYGERDANVYYGGPNVGGVLSKADVMESVTVNSNYILTVYSSGTANSVTVNSGGSLIVSRGGGIANEPIISSGGRMIVSSGGTALLVTSETGAVITSNTGAYITYK